MVWSQSQSIISPYLVSDSPAPVLVECFKENATLRTYRWTQTGKGRDHAGEGGTQEDNWGQGPMRL